MREEIGTVTGKCIDKKLYAEDQSLISNEYFIGVELEYENIQYFNKSSNYPDIFSFWTPVQDNSLREGTEFKFREPLKGANITKALEIMREFISKYRRGGTPISLSDRCSVHVHLDVTDLDINELTNLIMVYILVERCLFNYISLDRQKNNYCRPLTDSSFKSIIAKLRDSKKTSYALTAIKQYCDKYSALNILPSTSYGSIEFRHHPGTTNMEEVLDWINILLSLKKVALEIKIEELLEIYNTSYIEVLLSIFKGTKLEGEVSRDAIYDILLYKGVNDVKEILNFRSLEEITYKNDRRSSLKASLIEKFALENNLTIGE